MQNLSYCRNGWFNAYSRSVESHIERTMRRTSRASSLLPDSYRTSASTRPTASGFAPASISIHCLPRYVVKFILPQSGNVAASLVVCQPCVLRHSMWREPYRPHIKIRRPQRFEDTFDQRELTAEIASIEYSLTVQTNYLRRYTSGSPHVQASAVSLMTEQYFGWPVACRTNIEDLLVCGLGGMIRCRPSNAEVSDVRWACGRRQEDVGRLDVPMNDAQVMYV